MSYAVAQGLGSLIPLVMILATILFGRRARKLHAALIRDGVETVRARRARLRPWLYLLLVLAPLRLMAGRRPLLAKPMRPYMTRRQVEALEIQLGIIDLPAGPAPGAPAAGPLWAFEAMERAAMSAEKVESFQEAMQSALKTAQATVPVIGLEPAATGDPVLDSLRARRRRAWERMRDLGDIAAADSRALTAEEMGLWEVLEDEVAHLDIRIKQVIDAQHRAPKAGTRTVKACPAHCNIPSHVVNIRAIGDREDVWLAATLEHQEYMLAREAAEYERGRAEGEDIVRRITGRQS